MGSGIQRYAIQFDAVKIKTVRDSLPTNFVYRARVFLSAAQLPDAN